MKTFDEFAFATKGFNPQVEWVPVLTKDGIPGWMATRLSDGKKWFILLNPSQEGEGEPDVFIYTGPTEELDMAQHYYTPEFEE